jgi:hypothetical protein
MPDPTPTPVTPATPPPTPAVDPPAATPTAVAPAASPPATPVAAPTPTPPAAEAAAPRTESQPQKPMTLEEYLAVAPLEVREALQSGMKMHEAHKTSLITKLTATNRCKFTADQLKKMDVTMLENLVELAAVPNYGGTATGDSMRAHTTPKQDDGDSCYAPPMPKLEVVPATTPPKAA